MRRFSLAPVQSPTKESKLKNQNSVGPTKVINFREDIEDLKDTKNVEQVWVDFGKQHTKVHNYDPYDLENNREQEINFKAHQIYFCLPPDHDMNPSNVLLFELVFLSNHSSS
jgi:hypothetical protein